LEPIVILAVIIVLCKVIGVSNEMIVLGIMALVELVIVGMVLMFAYFCIRLAFSKKKTAKFTKIAKTEKSSFKVAFYMIDGEEYPCIFPSEMILNDKMYRPEKTYKVMYNQRMKKVFDIWTILTCILGLICSAFAVIGTLWILQIVQLW